LDRRYALKRQGYDLNTLAKRVSTLLGIDEALIYEKGRRKEQVRARNLFCYWAVEELGMQHKALSRQLSMGQPAVGYAVNRGKKFALSHKFRLID